VRVDEVALGIDHAISCGLILNELMTNALKYAFPNGRNGTIRVELHNGPENSISLRVADDGVGLPPDLDVKHMTTLGLQLVNNLVDQLDGTLEMETAEGIAYTISFEV
jgi:two-component sensor histidine kinase